jgi:hypothetical protein
MTENQSKEGVGPELMKHIYATNGGDASPDTVLNLYAECLGVVKGKTLELQRATMKQERAKIAKIP